MVGPLIIQAVLFFGVGLSFGGWLNEKPRQRFIRDAVRNPFYGAVAVFLAFWSVALGWFLYMQGFDFSFGEYGAMQNPFAVFLVAFCFTAAVTAFAMAAATLTGNGWTAPAVVIMSAPVFFISGAVWPLENHPLRAGLCAAYSHDARDCGFCRCRAGRCGDGGYSARVPATCASDGALPHISLLAAVCCAPQCFVNTVIFQFTQCARVIYSVG